MNQIVSRWLMHMLIARSTFVLRLVRMGSLPTILLLSVEGTVLAFSQTTQPENVWRSALALRDCMRIRRQPLAFLSVHLVIQVTANNGYAQQHALQLWAIFNLYQILVYSNALLHSSQIQRLVFAWRTAASGTTGNLATDSVCNAHWLA